MAVRLLLWWAAAGLLLALPAALALNCTERPLKVAAPRWYRKAIDQPLSFLRYDGISPFLNKGAEVKGHKLNLFLQGRGNASPLAGDAFGAGQRLSSVHAFKGGKVCARMRNPDPRSGTIIGLYLIDVHPKGSARWSTTWREVDYEWLGLKPNEVQTSLFEQGRNQPNAQHHNLAQVTRAPVTQRDPIKYCIEWDLLSDNNKVVRWTAKAKGKDEVTVREWRPSSPEVNRFWDVPLRAVFTFWSNNNIVEWSGPYNLGKDTVLKAEFSDVKFEPKGPPYCVENDDDLEPSTWA